jgi:hypothetical protein
MVRACSMREKEDAKVCFGRKVRTKESIERTGYEWEDNINRMLRMWSGFV